MGWTGTSVMDLGSYWDFKKSDYDFKAFLDNQFNCENEQYKWELLKSSMVGSTWYGAVKHTEKATGKFEVYGQTILTSKENNWFYQKEVDETMGPFSIDCPIGILNCLTPTDNPYALQWREKCRVNHTHKQYIAGLWRMAQDKKKTQFLAYTLPYTMKGGSVTYKKGDVIYLSYSPKLVKGKVKNCWNDEIFRFKRKDIDIFACTFISPTKEEFTPIRDKELEAVINKDYIH